MRMCRSLVAVVLIIGGRALTAGAGQAAVGPVVPQPGTVATHERNLHVLLSPQNVDKLWREDDAAELRQFLTDLQDAQITIEGIVGPVAPKPKPKPRPVTPGSKPDGMEIEQAAAALHRTLEDANQKSPSLRLPADVDARLRRITTALKSEQP